MAINDLPSPSDPAALPGGLRNLRSYREAASHLVRSEEQRSRSPVESRPSKPRTQRKHPGPKSTPTLSLSSSPRSRSAVVSPPPSPSSPSPSSSPSSRCRSRTPSPPHSSPSTGGGETSPQPSSGNKALRCVSPGGTPAASAGAALRKQGQAASLRASVPRRVRWAELLVASVRTRPRTPRADIPLLFYSRADEKRFRREVEVTYSFEDEWCEGMELEGGNPSPPSFVEPEAPRNPPQLPSPPLSEQHQPLWSPRRERKDYAISKAVVVFGGAERTYGCDDCSPLIETGCAVEAALESSSEFSFDDAAFWNGQLTWS